MEMNDFFHWDTGSIPVRTDILQAFRRSWRHIATAGSAWSGPARVAIASECRAAWECELCAERKNALSPNSVKAKHEGSECLPAVAIEAIHRITTDPGRLTENWFTDLLADGLTDSQYVEIIGIVSTVTSIDTFCCALGLPLERLPEPQLGDPSRYRPERLKTGGSWLPMLMETDLASPEQDLYGGSKRGANVLRCMSLVPNEVRNLLQISGAMYLSDRDVPNFRATGGRAISRDQMELLSSRVSMINECFY